MDRRIPIIHISRIIGAVNVHFNGSGPSESGDVELFSAISEGVAAEVKHLGGLALVAAGRI